MRIEIVPLEEIVLEKGTIALGDDKTVIEKVLGQGTQTGDRHYYFNANMAIDYNSNNQVEFIEFLGGIDGELHPLIYNVPVFETEAEELAKLLCEKNGSEGNDLENGYSLSFSSISIGVYRETTPKAVQEMIDEMKGLGISTDDNDDVRIEWRKANHWATIGVGIQDYYRK